MADYKEDNRLTILKYDQRLKQMDLQLLGLDIRRLEVERELVEMTKTEEALKIQMEEIKVKKAELGKP